VIGEIPVASPFIEGGTVTLEILGLLLNPFNRTLEPMREMLALTRDTAAARES
jgi:hypothetical protein